MSVHSTTAYKVLRRGLARAGYRTKPDFLIIGAQKSGTTALHEYLSQHPATRPAFEKEVRYFSDDRNFRKGAAWYAQFFPLPHAMSKGRVTFESTPEYLYYPFVAERIHRFKADMKLVIVLRDPVERAYSAWNMFRQFRDPSSRYVSIAEHRSFEVAVRQELEHLDEVASRPGPGYVRRGLYARQIQVYLRHFAKEDILVLDSVALRRDSESVMQRVTHFVGIDDGWTGYGFAPVHERPYESEPPTATFELLREFYAPHNRELVSMLEMDFEWM